LEVCGTILLKQFVLFIPRLPDEVGVRGKHLACLSQLVLIYIQLGFTNASLFTRGHVRFVSLDGISFARPVPIGSILNLTSHILHSDSTNQFPALVVHFLAFYFYPANTSFFSMYESELMLLM
jgi:hypothetical protein